MFGEKVRRLVLVSIISMLIIQVSKETCLEIQEKFLVKEILYLYYIAQFAKFSIEMFMGSSNKDNAIQPRFAKKLDLRIYKTMVHTEKIDGGGVETYKIFSIMSHRDNKNKEFYRFETNSIDKYYHRCYF